MTVTLTLSCDDGEIAQMLISIYAAYELTKQDDDADYGVFRKLPSAIGFLHDVLISYADPDEMESVLGDEDYEDLKRWMPGFGVKEPA